MVPPLGCLGEASEQIFPVKNFKAHLSASLLWYFSVQNWLHTALYIECVWEGVSTVPDARWSGNEWVIFVGCDVQYFTRSHSVAMLNYNFTEIVHCQGNVHNRTSTVQIWYDLLPSQFTNTTVMCPLNRSWFLFCPDLGIAPLVVGQGDGVQIACLLFKSFTKWTCNL